MWILGAIQAGLGLYQTIRGAVEQQKLSKMQAPKYGLTASMKAAKGQAEQMAQMGYTPQERAAFEQRLATGSNTAFRRAVDMSGGNMAQAIQGALNAQNIMGQNQFAAQDAALRRQNIAARNQIYGQEQALDNQNVAMQNQLMMQRAQSLGAQGQSGLGNLLGGLGGIFGGMNGLGGGAKSQINNLGLNDPNTLNAASNFQNNMDKLGTFEGGDASIITSPKSTEYNPFFPNRNKYRFGNSYFNFN